MLYERVARSCTSATAGSPRLRLPARRRGFTQRDDMGRKFLCKQDRDGVADLRSEMPFRGTKKDEGVFKCLQPRRLPQRDCPVLNRMSVPAVADAVATAGQCGGRLIPRHAAVHV